MNATTTTVDRRSRSDERTTRRRDDATTRRRVTRRMKASRAQRSLLYYIRGRVDRLHSPLLPPIFDSNRTRSMTMSLLTALHMS